MRTRVKWTSWVGLLTLLAIVGTPFVTLRAAAGVPKVLNYQGRLYDSSGNVLGGSGTNYCFRFSIYDASSTGAGVKLWPSGTPASMVAPVRNGVFSLGVGDVAAGGDLLDFNFEDNDSVYLNVEVATRSGGLCGTFESLNPRPRIMASGYAVNAGTVRGFSAAQNASGTQIPVLSSGNLVFGGVNPQINATGTNALVLQGGTGTGNIQFFSSNNFLTATGTLNIAGLLQSANINQFLTTTSTPTFNGINFTNATATGNFQTGSLNVTGVSTLAGLLFGNATGTGNIQSATLGVSGHTSLAAVSSTNFQATGSLVVGGDSILQGVTLANATATGNVQSATLSVSGASTLNGITFVNATGTGNLQSVTLNITGAATLNGVTFTNATSTGNVQASTFVATGGSSLQGISFTNATGTGGLTIAGILSSQNINQFLNTTSTPTFNDLTLNNFATGSIPFIGSGRALASSSLFAWNSASSTLGIGSSSINGRLDLYGLSTSSQTYVFRASDIQGVDMLTVRDDSVITLGKTTGTSTVSVGVGTGQNKIYFGTSTAQTSLLFQSAATDNVLTLNSNSVSTSTAITFNASALTNGYALEVNGLNSSPLFTIGRSSTGSLDYARVTVGGTSTQDQLYVYGRINSSWRVFHREWMQTCAPAAALAVDTADICGLYFDEDADGAVLARTASNAGLRLEAGNQSVTVGDGAALGSGGPIGITLANNPVLEARLAPATGIAGTRIGLGFTDRAIGGDVAADPTNGIFFVASGTGNWLAKTKSGAASTTVNTNVIASTTAMRVLRIQVNSTSSVDFFIDDALVASINSTTTVPSSTVMGFGVNVAVNSGAVRPDLDVEYMKVWIDDPPGGGSSIPESPNTPVFDAIQSADIAERYLAESPAEFPSGALVSLDPAGGSRVKKSEGAYDRDLFGVITTSPHTILGSDDAESVAVALVGRVPVIVNGEGGSIAVGDWITASSEPGEGMKATSPGVVIGRALEAWNASSSATGTVLVTLEKSERLGGALTQESSLIGSAVDAVAALGRFVGQGVLKLSHLVIDQISAQVGNFKNLFASRITILPEGALELPSGTNQPSGRGTLPTGLAEIFVSNTSVKEDSKILVTPLVPVVGSLAVIEKVAGQGFKVALPSSADRDVPFDWIIVQTYGESASPPAQGPPPSTPVVEAPPPGNAPDPEASTPPAAEPESESTPESQPVETESTTNP